MSANIWQKCAKLLEEEFSPRQFNTWLLPLQADIQENTLILLAPNKFVAEWVKKNFFVRIKELILQHGGEEISTVSIAVGTKVANPVLLDKQTTDAPPAPRMQKPADYITSNISKKFDFDNFVEGNSNQFARAASLAVADRPGVYYTTLLSYEGGG